MNRFDWFFAHLYYACKSLLVRGPNVHVIVFATGDDDEAATQAGTTALRVVLSSLTGDLE